MKFSLKVIALSALAVNVLCSTSIKAKEVEMDRISAIVNTSVVLESDVEDLIQTVKLQAKQSDQSLPSDNALRTQVMDKLINDALISEIGERMGVQVSDAMLDQTLTNMGAEAGLTLEQYKEKIVSDGIDYEKYRENVRTELVTGEVTRASVRRRIYIPPQEVNSLLEMMKEQTNDNVEYHIGHILIEFPAEPTQKDMSEAKIRAEKVIELLNNGSDFAKIAIASSGDSSALQGGDMGWKSINEMPTLFSEIIDGKEKGSVFGPIRTGLGFSIVKILDLRGKEVVEVEETKSRHILIEPSIILSEAKAESMLAEFIEKIKSGEEDFAELAKEHSDGPSSVKGGDLGWADPTTYDPAFTEQLARLKVGELSAPFRTSFGWHIVELTDRRTLDATQQMNQNKAYQMLFNRKFAGESARWIKETRDEAYIEIFDLGNK